jgi:hypothetical protein
VKERLCSVPAVRADRPINADVPAGETSRDQGSRDPAEPVAAPPAPSRKPRLKLRTPPLTPILLSLIVLVAIAFLAVAVIGGSGGSGEEAVESPAPALAPAGDASSGPAAETAAQLGYPAFATGNTTRVGGSDPAATAAAVALAVFPSTTPALRPDAVTLVDEDDWPGAIAASVLMSAPPRAPILFSTAGEIPDATGEALAALDPQGSEASDGDAAFVVGDATAPPGALSRVDAGSPAAEAAEIAALRDRLFGAPPKHVVIVPSGSPAFAMPAAAWAARSGDPILFAGRDSLPGPTATALRRHTKVPVYVLGPASAISAKVVREIASIGPRVKRVAAADAVASAVAFARYADGSFGWNVNDPGHGFVLSREDSPLNAAAAAPLSASGTWGPLLLSDDPSRLPAAVRSYFLDVKPGYTTDPTRAFYNHVWVIGDQEAIDVNQQAEVDHLAELAKIGGEG